MDIKKLIESSKSTEAITSEIYQEQNEFEKLSSTLTEKALGNANGYSKVYSKEVNIPLSDPAHFDDKTIRICYGKRTDESCFVLLETKRGTQYIVGDSKNITEAYEQAKVLTKQRKINLQELHSQRVT